MNQPSLPQVFHRARCPFCRRLRAYLDERDMPVELRAYDPERDHGALLALNPKAQVPTWDGGDDGVKLFDSSIIIDYLEEAHADGLSPSTPAARARARLLTDLSDQWFTPKMVAFIRAPVDHPSRPKASRELVEHAATAVRYLDAEGPWAVEGRFTTADLTLPPLIFRAIESGFDPVTCLPPRLLAWCRAVLERPSVKALYPEVSLDG